MKLGVMFLIRSSMIKLEKLNIFLTEEHPIMNNSENKELLERTATNLKVSAFCIYILCVISRKKYNSNF